MLGEAARCPGVRALKRLFLVGARVQEARELVEGKHDVAAKLVLDPHRHLGIEAMLGAVDMAGEDHAVVVDDRVGGFDGLHLDLRIGRVSFAGELLGENLLEAGAQRQHLEAAGIRVGGTRPVHELSEAACLVNNVRTGLQVQVVGVGEDSLRTQSSHHLGSECLDVRFRADGNESRGADVAVRGMNYAGASEASVGLHSVPDRKSAVGGVPTRRGRCLERRELLGIGGGQPVLIHQLKTSSFFSPSVRRMAAMTG